VHSLIICVALRGALLECSPVSFSLSITQHLPTFAHERLGPTSRQCRRVADIAVVEAVEAEVAVEATTIARLRIQIGRMVSAAASQMPSMHLLQDHHSNVVNHPGPAEVRVAEATQIGALPATSKNQAGRETNIRKPSLPRFPRPNLRLRATE